MASVGRCGAFHFPERECKNCGHKMNYILDTIQKGLGNFRASGEHAWVCPKCNHIEREPMKNV
jgi:ribosomal protein L32